MATAEKTGPKTHTINITNAGGLIIKKIVPQAGWYEKVPLNQAFGAQEAVQNLLSDLNMPDFNAVEDEDKWGDKPLTLTPLTESQREGLKACVKAYLDKAALGLTPAVRNLASELGILE